MTAIRVKQENANKPATYKQRIALWLASNKQTDYRTANLTMLQASELLANINASKVPTSTSKIVSDHVSKRSNSVKMSKVSKPTMKDELIAYIKENMSKIAAHSKESLQVQGVVKNDENFVKDDGKRYIICGFGCAFVYMEFDKRSKKAKEIYELSRSVRSEMSPYFADEFTKEEQNYFNRVGCPLSALFMQDVMIQQAYFGVVRDFMLTKGCKNIRVNYRMD